MLLFTDYPKLVQYAPSFCLGKCHIRYYLEVGGMNNKV